MEDKDRFSYLVRLKCQLCIHYFEFGLLCSKVMPFNSYHQAHEAFHFIMVSMGCSML